MSSPRNLIKSTKTSFEIIHALQEMGPSRLSSIAEQVQLPESTTHRHLNTLQDLRYVSRQGNLYQIGLRFARLGRTAQTRDPRYIQAESYVKDLANQTEERVQFVVEEHGLGIYLYQETGSKAVRIGSSVGRQAHLHCTAAGKMLLANYSADRVTEIIDRWGLPTYTEKTITDIDTLFEELERIKERGYAFNREEQVTGVNAVAVSVQHNDTVIGVFSVSGPSHRLHGEWFEEQIPNLMLATANEFELDITYSGSDGSQDHLVE